MATAADPLTENPEFFTHEIRKSVLRDPPRDRGYPPGLVPLSFALRRAVARRRRRDGAILPPDRGAVPDGLRIDRRRALPADQRIDQPNLSSVADYRDGGGADAARRSAGKEPGSGAHFG